MSSKERELIITKALNSPEGREALAKSMKEPLISTLMYGAIGRKLLLVDELPGGALLRYQKDINVKSYTIYSSAIEDIIRKILRKIECGKIYLEEPYDYMIDDCDLFKSLPSEFQDVKDWCAFFKELIDDCLRVYQLSQLYPVED